MEIDLSGDIEAEHTDAYGSTSNVFSLRLTPDNEETAVVAETDKSNYIGCNVEFYLAQSEQKRRSI